MTTSNKERKLWEILSNVQTNRRKMLEERIKELEEKLEKEKVKEVKWICLLANKANR